MKKIILLLTLILGIILINSNVNAANNITERLKGRLLLQVEQGGAIWYVNPLDSKKYQVTFANALSLFENFALGITNADLIKIPANLESIKPDLDSDGDGYKDRTELEYYYSPYIPGDNKGKFTTDNNLAHRLKGRLLLQVEQRGAIWYVDHTGIRHSVRWDNLMDLFRGLALGITNSDLAKINTGHVSASHNIKNENSCTSNWQCGTWSQCSISGSQSRVCSDLNNCGITQNKPTESQSCSYQAPTVSTKFLNDDPTTQKILSGQISQYDMREFDYLAKVDGPYKIDNYAYKIVSAIKMLGYSQTSANMSVGAGIYYSVLQLNKFQKQHNLPQSHYLTAETLSKLVDEYNKVESLYNNGRSFPLYNDFITPPENEPPKEHYLTIISLALQALPQPLVVWTKENFTSGQLATDYDESKKVYCAPNYYNAFKRNSSFPIVCELKFTEGKYVDNLSLTSDKLEVATYLHEYAH